MRKNLIYYVDINVTCKQNVSVSFYCQLKDIINGIMNGLIVIKEYTVFCLQLMETKKYLYIYYNGF